MCSLRGACRLGRKQPGPGGVHSPAGLAGGLWVPHVFVLAARGPLSLHLPPSLSHHFPFPAPERGGSPRALGRAQVTDLRISLRMRWASCAAMGRELLLPQSGGLTAVLPSGGGRLRSGQQSQRQGPQLSWLREG